MSSHYDNQFLLIKLILLLLISLKNQPRIIFNIINEVQSTYATQFTCSLAILAGPCLLIPTGWTHSRRSHYKMGTQFSKAVQLDDAALNFEHSILICSQQISSSSQLSCLYNCDQQVQPKRSTRACPLSRLVCKQSC